MNILKLWIICFIFTFSGLFRAAISNSGSALCNWAYQRNAVKTAYGIAEEIDSSFSENKTHEELLEFLTSVDADAIDKTGAKYHVGEMFLYNKCNATKF